MLRALPYRFTIDKVIDEDGRQVYRIWRFLIFKVKGKITYAMFAFDGYYYEIYNEKRNTRNNK